jgi:hypothetical protein
MNATQWAGLIVSVLTILGIVGGGIRWMVKHYLMELKPNGGSSLVDKVNRLESRVDEIYSILINKN